MDKNLYVFTIRPCFIGEWYKHTVFAENLEAAYKQAYEIGMQTRVEDVDLTDASLLLFAKPEIWLDRCLIDGFSRTVNVALDNEDVIRRVEQYLRD